MGLFPFFFFLKICKLWTINALYQKEKKSYNLIVLTEMLIRQHELKNISEAASTSRVFTNINCLCRVVFATLNATALRHAFSSLG